MSDEEESFVILGSSPLSSLENDGMDTRKTDSGSSLESDTPGSRFASLKNSQLIDMKNAQNADNEIEPQMAIFSTKNFPDIQKSFIKMAESVKKTVPESDDIDESIAASKLWSRKPLVQVEENMIPLSLEDCALKYPLEQQQEHNSKESNEDNCTPTQQQKSSIKTADPVSGDRNLAASFLMGEVNSDVLKTSVYSQFPSISMEASAEDVLKLQNMVTEYTDLKATIKKANNTMKLFYNNSLQWKDKMKTMEEQYKQQLTNCQKEIEELRNLNKKLESSFRSQIEALQVARKEDREENIQEISEKNALLENMRAQIVKLEQQQLNSFEVVMKNQDEQQAENFNTLFITRRDHELEIKKLQSQLSEILASNLNFKDIEKQYIDELTCLKVNLVSAEELIKKNSNEIIQVTASNREQEKQIETLKDNLRSLQLAFEEQKERISLLETQNEVYRTDFEMEKQSRETVCKEKQQILQDLRSLQKKNQELIEEHQKLADSYQKRLSTAAANNGAQIAAASVAESYFNNPQRPIRVLPSPSASVASAPAATHMCPICNKAFKSLHILLSHVNDCVDKY